MEFTAKAMFMRVSPQKARLVLDLIKGLRVEQALNTLAFTNKRVAPLVHKLLRSAIENANYMNQEKGVEVDVDRLFVKRAIANEGPRMKRIRPAPMGRAYRYQRRMSHLEIAGAEKPSDGGAGQESGSQTAGEKSSGQESAGQEGEEGLTVAVRLRSVSRALPPGIRKRIVTERGSNASAEKRRKYGTEGPSIRIPPRLHQALESALVHGSRLRQVADRRHQAEE
jgi:large subunit ribosomal protein L22